MATSVDAIHKSSDQINPDQMYVKKKSEFNVKIASDTRQTCYVSGICIFCSGETIVADYTNKIVKKVDNHYNVSSIAEVDSNPLDICQISNSRVAVTFHKAVQFFTVNNVMLYFGYLSLDGGGYNKTDFINKLSLQHDALGITSHQDDLYITSGTALYHYTLKDYWQLNRSLYEDTEGGITVDRCALSPDGNWIYVTNSAQNKLITLTIDGTLMSTFTDPELVGPKGVHVTPTGQVLVCGIISHTVIQVDREGKKKLATLASEKDGLRCPVSICYNTNTDQIIVGVYASNNIRVMEL